MNNPKKNQVKLGDFEATEEDLKNAGAQVGIVPDDAPDQSYLDLMKHWKGAVTRFLEAYNVNLKADPLDHATIRDAWVRTIASSKEARVFVLSKEGLLLEFNRTDFLDFAFRDLFGGAMSKAFHEACADALGGITSKSERKEFREAAAKVLLKPMLEKLVIARQFDRMSVAIDPFSDGNIQMNGKAASVTLPMQNIKAPKVSKEAVARAVADFREHFPQFDDVVQLVCKARFASDRRQAFVWLRAGSNFGKGLLIEVFNRLGVIVEVSVSLINKIIANETVGLDAGDCAKAWILTVDEWKGASRELKQLNTRMGVTAKYANRVMVPLYTKLFTSAENVGSLIDGGIESQFNNRFSYINPGDADINERPLLNEGKEEYIDALAAHVAAEMNQAIARARKLGKRAATKESDEWVGKFQRANRLDDSFGSLDETVRAIANDIRDLIKRFAEANESKRADDKGAFNPIDFSRSTGIDYGLVAFLQRNAKTGWVGMDDGTKSAAMILGQQNNFVSQYLEKTRGRTESSKLGYKSAEIARFVGSTGVTVDKNGRIKIFGHGDAATPRGEQSRSVAVVLK